MSASIYLNGILNIPQEKIAPPRPRISAPIKVVDPGYEVKERIDLQNISKEELDKIATRSLSLKKDQSLIREKVQIALGTLRQRQQNNANADNS